MDASHSWLLMQMTDSALPTGGFIHSGGLEAAWQLGEFSADDLAGFMEDALEQFAWMQLPFACATHRDPESVEQRDRDFDVRCLVPAANRASRAQGGALLGTTARAMTCPEVIALRARAKRQRQPCHWAPYAGAITRLLGLPLRESMRSLVYIQLRSQFSSAVRLGAIGPLAAQGLQHRLSGVAERMLEQALSRPWEDAAQCFPLLELLHGCHDRLYSRLFAS